MPSRTWHGYFTCVAEADDVDDALEKFGRLIPMIRDTDGDLFEGVTHVYLEACVEIRKIPPAGFLALYKLLEGEDPGGISTAIRGATDREAVEFETGPTDERDPEIAHEAEPFVTFGPSRRCGRRRPVPAKA